ncbi:conserved hypothetical protein [Desulforamulus reducens MI-1]|uniref:Uncharacterized protein n=1 Tax=Desulforamulus reducens (strain ATCC BAA-1160 / DSM 100696 / MI-1) TaxID=349161 RepID=A4J1S3_DESRM|nr:hypothetical protein [Desulforamulus reducens]ABO49026.1 conserved hypothetical protein [Desulforamulus reducens MI-1]
MLIKNEKVIFGGCGILHYIKVVEWIYMEPYKMLIYLLVGLILESTLGLTPAQANTGEVLKQHQQLKQREQQIVAELLQMELHVDRVNQNMQLVQLRLAKIQKTIPHAHNQLVQSKKKLKYSRQKLNIWLRHLYMEGRTNYLIILFGAENLGDFFNRLAMVGMLVSRGIGDYQRTYEAMGEVKKKTEELTKLEQQLVSQQNELTKDQKKIISLQMAKKQFLEVTRQEMGQQQDKILQVVEGVHRSLKPLETILARFKDASWEQYRPDHLEWLGTHVKAEYSQNTFSKVLFSGAGLKIPAAVTLRNQSLIIKGVNEEHLPFTIAGELRVNGNNVCYWLSSIQIGDVLLDEELVKKIAGENGLVYPLDILRGWRLKDIQIFDGKAVFELVPA